MLFPRNSKAYIPQPRGRVELGRWWHWVAWQSPSTNARAHIYNKRDSIIKEEKEEERKERGERKGWRGGMTTIKNGTLLLSSSSGGGTSNPIESSEPSISDPSRRVKGRREKGRGARRVARRVEEGKNQCTHTHAASFPLRPSPQATWIPPLFRHATDLPSPSCV